MARPPSSDTGRHAVDAGKRDATAWTTLETWASHAWCEGVQVETLGDLTPLQVCTRNNVYDIIVTCARTREVAVCGGSYFPEHARARLAGSSLGGSFLKLGGVYVGFCMELYTDAGRIVTSPVRSIRILEPYLQ